jgi:hypothetical protein
VLVETKEEEKVNRDNKGKAVSGPAHVTSVQEKIRSPFMGYLGTIHRIKKNKKSYLRRGSRDCTNSLFDISLTDCLAT